MSRILLYIINCLFMSDLDYKERRTRRKREGEREKEPNEYIPTNHRPRLDFFS